jgi:acetoin utilization deacetylase AcuC-like enzyme
MKPTGIVRDPAYLKHVAGDHHPESPERLSRIYEMLEELGPSLNIREIPARNATQAEISAVHDPRYVSHIASTAGRSETLLDPDTGACSDSWDAASRAVGGLLNLLDAVMAGGVRNGFALVRPPGHHAERRRAMGFCLFNNVALAARHALNEHGMERVAIVDWDLHHGNGTQNAFYDDARVLFVSAHQYPHYPGTGGIREVGQGPGEGFTVNIPLPPGIGDIEYATVFHAIVAPVLEAFRPQLILVSAGFDAHAKDPLGGLNLTEEGYEQMVQMLMHLAAEFCSDRLVLTLEGGYNPRALRDSVARVITNLSTYDPGKEPGPLGQSMEKVSAAFKNRLRDVLSIQQKYWLDLEQI